MRAIRVRVAVTLLCSTLLTGCTSGGEATPPSTPSASPSHAATPTPTPTISPREQAAADAEAVVRRYYEVTDRLGQDRRAPLRLLKTVAASVELTSLRTNLEANRRKGWVQTGALKIKTLDVRNVSLDNSAPKAGRVPTVTIDVCYDVSDVDVVDASGKSVIAKGRPDQATTRLFVSNYDWPKDERGGWRVAGGKDLGEGRCS